MINIKEDFIREVIRRLKLKEKRMMGRREEDKIGSFKRSWKKKLLVMMLLLGRLGSISKRSLAVERKISICPLSYQL